MAYGIRNPYYTPPPRQQPQQQEQKQSGSGGALGALGSVGGLLAGRYIAGEYINPFVNRAAHHLGNYLQHGQTVATPTIASAQRVYPGQVAAQPVAQTVAQQGAQVAVQPTTYTGSSAQMQLPGAQGQAVAQGQTVATPQGMTAQRVPQQGVNTAGQMSALQYVGPAAAGMVGGYLGNEAGVAAGEAMGLQEQQSAALGAGVGGVAGGAAAGAAASAAGATTASAGSAAASGAATGGLLALPLVIGYMGDYFIDRHRGEPRPFHAFELLQDEDDLMDLERHAPGFLSLPPEQQYQVAQEFINAGLFKPLGEGRHGSKISKEQKGIAHGSPIVGAFGSPLNVPVDDPLAIYLTVTGKGGANPYKPGVDVTPQMAQQWLSNKGWSDEVEKIRNFQSTIAGIIPPDAPALDDSVYQMTAPGGPAPGSVSETRRKPFAADPYGRGKKKDYDQQLKDTIYRNQDYLGQEFGADLTQVVYEDKSHLQNRWYSIQQAFEDLLNEQENQGA